MINRLVSDGAFEYITPDMTRATRSGETDKCAVSDKEFDRNLYDGKYICVNEIFGTRYGTPRVPVEVALRFQTPSHVLDFPLERLSIAEQWSGHKSGIVIMPASFDVLMARLEQAGRAERLEEAARQYTYYCDVVETEVPELVGNRVIISDEEVEAIHARVVGMLEKLSRGAE